MTHQRDGAADVTITTLGVDIGSATTQVSVSRAVIRPVGARLVLVRSEPVYLSPVVLTPFVGDTLDAAALDEQVRHVRAELPVPLEEIQGGVVLITGSARGTVNARAIAEAVSRHFGDLASVSAGDHMEALLAAHGSGAVRASRAGPVLSLDMGGGTTKIGLCVQGDVRATACLDVGSRLVAWDEATRRVIRVEPGFEPSARALGMGLSAGDVLPPERERAIAHHMARVVYDAVTTGRSAATAPYLRPSPAGFDLPGEPLGIICSGGVSDYVYGHQSHRFGDLGPALAGALTSLLGNRLRPPVGPTLRATSMGCAQHAVQISGTTIHVSRPELLPLSDVPVICSLRPGADGGGFAPALRESVLRHVEHGGAGDARFALYITWTGPASFERIGTLAREIHTGLDVGLPDTAIVVIAVDSDIAHTLGHWLTCEMPLAWPSVCLDGVRLRELDYLDVGTVHPSAGFLTATVKSLVFMPSPGQQPKHEENGA